VEYITLFWFKTISTILIQVSGALLVVIHIAPIGVEVAHVYEGIKDKQLGAPDKLYLLHSPNQKSKSKTKSQEGQFKKIAQGVKNKLEPICETILVEINAFQMNSVWDAINKIIKEEFENDEMLNLNDFAINVTGGTNLMAVASTIAAGSRGVRAYYVTNKKFKENKPPYVKELTIPNFKTEREINKKLQQLLRVIFEYEYHWEGVNTNPHSIEKDGPLYDVVVEDEIKTHWMNERFEKGWILRSELLKIMKEVHNIPKQTTTNRLNLLQERGLIKINSNIVPMEKKPTSSASIYAKIVYKIDNKKLMISITPNGISELRFQKKD